jgi:hypothetical protein
LPLYFAARRPPDRVETKVTTPRRRGISFIPI